MYLMASLAGRSFPNTEPVSAGTVCLAPSKTSVMLKKHIRCSESWRFIQRRGSYDLPAGDDTVLMAGDILVNGVVKNGPVARGRCPK